MQKEELLHLHMLMIHIKKYAEAVTGERSRHDNVTTCISPVHIHKNKYHKDAILTLGNEIVGISGSRPAVVKYSVQPHRLPLSTDRFLKVYPGDYLLFLSSPPGERDLARCRVEICQRYNLPAVPKNSAILASLPEEKRKEFAASCWSSLAGHSPVSLHSRMTSPAPCPTGSACRARGPEHRSDP